MRNKWMRERRGAAADLTGGMECACLQQHKNNPARMCCLGRNIHARLSSQVISFLCEQYQLDLLIYAFINPVRIEAEISEIYLKEPNDVKTSVRSVRLSGGDARL